MRYILDEEAALLLQFNIGILQFGLEIDLKSYVIKNTAVASVYDEWAMLQQKVVGQKYTDLHTCDFTYL